MNSNALITRGLGVLTSLRAQVKDRSNDLARSDYDELRESALRIHNLRDRINVLADGQAKESVRRGLLEAGPVTQSAHLRLANMRQDAEGTLGALANRADDLATKSSREARKQATKYGKRFRPFQKKAAKTSKRVQKRAEDAAQKVTDRMTGKQAKRQQRLRRFGAGAGIAALIAAVTAVVYTILDRRRKAEAAILTTPPRVEEEAGEQEAKLVYTTATDEPGTPVATLDDPDVIDDPEESPEEREEREEREEPAERDEELLESLDEQLRVNREAHNQTREN